MWYFLRRDLLVLGRLDQYLIPYCILGSHNNFFTALASCGPRHKYCHINRLGLYVVTSIYQSWLWDGTPCMLVLSLTAVLGTGQSYIFVLAPCCSCYLP